MNTSTQPPSIPLGPPPRGVSGTILILLLALTVCATAAIILAVLHFLHPASSGGAGEALQQRGTVSPRSTFTGIVYYPVPYSAPPNLKLTATKRQYDIVKQDETGFTWKAVIALDDIRDEQRGNAEALINVGVRHVDSHGVIGMLKPNLQCEDFHWEAKGVRTGRNGVFVQEGTFNTVASQEGEVNFPMPYAIAPNVELTGQASGAVIVVESRPTSFKWKNVPQTSPFATNSGSVSWKAKGVRGTEIPQPKPQ